MIKIKHFLDTVEQDDGQRIWIEPIGLTKDLREMCNVDHVLSHLGPPLPLWQWYEQHPDGYEFFRGKYHEHLSHSQYRGALQQLATASLRETFTLIHQCDDSEHNSAAALHEFISELQAYSPQE